VTLSSEPWVSSDCFLGGDGRKRPSLPGKLIKYRVRFSEREERTQIIPKVKTTTPIQQKYLNMVGIRNPMSLERFVW